MIFEVLQSGLCRFNLHALSLKISKIPEFNLSIKYHSNFSNEILWIHKSRVTREEWSVANGGFYVVETNVNINLNQWKRTHNNVKQWN